MSVKAEAIHGAGQVGSGSEKLPRGLKQPKIIQTLRWVLKPLPFLNQCREKFGDAFTVKLPIGNSVFISDPELIKEVFRGDSELFKAGEANAVALGPILGPNSVLTLDGPEHMRQRKLMLPAFHGDRMRSYQDLIEEITEASISDWPVGEAFPIHRKMQEITLQVIMRAVFGIEDAKRLDELGASLRKLLDTASGARLRIPLVLYLLASRRLGLSSQPPFVRRYIDRVDNLLYDEIEKRRKTDDLAERTDVLSSLIEARDEDGNQMSDKELRDELMTLLLAGHETTATALAWTFDLLFQNPKEMAKLREEINRGEDDNYVDAVIKESLRLRPVLPAAARRLQAPYKLDGYTLPENTAVVPCIYLVHRREDLYPQPDEFRPERFLNGGRDTYGWIPFGGGIRRCLGASFALYEMRVVIKTVLNDAQLSSARAVPEETTRRFITLSPKGGTPTVYYGTREAAIAAKKSRKKCLFI